MPKLVLVRHGESQWNAKGLWTGWTDIGLSEKGRQEARGAAMKLKDLSFHLGLSSDLKRAWETLDIIKETLNLADLPTSRHFEFKERHYGIYSGRNKWQIKESLGDKKFKQLRRGWDFPIPEGESLKDVYKRVVAGYKKHIYPEIKNSRNLLLSAHGNSIRALMKHLEKIDDDKITDIELDTGEIILYTISPFGKIINREKRK